MQLRGCTVEGGCAEVASRWQQYQAAGRKGVGEKALAAWEAGESKRASKDAAYVAKVGGAQAMPRSASGARDVPVPQPKQPKP